MPGSPDWAGTALVHGIDILADGFGVHMGAGQTISFPPFNINRPGYLMNVGATYDGASGTSPLCQMDVSWYDQGMNTHFGHETWEFPVGTNGNGFFHTGRGPTKGQLLGLAFTNVDSAQPVTATFWFAQTTQAPLRDDIRLHLEGISPVWQAGLGETPPENQLLNLHNLSVPTGSLTPILIPLYSGQAYLFWECTGQSAANDVTIEILPASGSGSQADVYKSLAGATPFISASNQLIALPRRVCLLEVSNSGAATATLNLVLTALEYSS